VKDKYSIEILQAIENGALKSDTLPGRLKLFNWGENITLKGPVLITALTAEEMPRNQREAGFSRIAIDFEHNTVPGTPAYKEFPPPHDIAGYGTPVVIPLAADGSNIEEAGLWVLNVEWTPIGKKKAQNYRALSPTPARNKNGELVFIHSVALVPNGAVEGLTFFAADIPYSGKKSLVDGQTNKKEQDMDAFRKLWCKWLGADESIADADLMKAIDSKIAEMNGAMKSVTEMSAQIAGINAKLNALDTLNVKVADQEKLIAAFSADSAQRERDLVVMGAMVEGKVIPLSVEEIGSTPLANLKSMVAKIEKSVVPLWAKTPSMVSEPNAGGVNQYEAHVKKICGG